MVSPVTASANTANRVNFPRLARELGLTRRQAEDIATSGLVDVSTPGPPRPRQISLDDAERVRQAVRIAAAAAIGVLIVLRLLASGAVTPNDP